jgi:hypothetical protein
MTREAALILAALVAWPAAAGATPTRAARAKERAASAYNHEGFRARVDLGIGRLAAHGRAEERSDRRVSGTTASWSLSLGGAVTSTCTLGGVLALDHAFAVAAKDERTGPVDMDGVELNHVFWGPQIDCYLSKRGGLHASLALGSAELNVNKDGEHARDYESGDPSPDPSGMGALVGVGYDRFVAAEVSLGVFARLLVAPLEVSETDDTTRVLALIPVMGLELTFD